MDETMRPNMGVILEKLDNLQGDVIDIKKILTCHVEEQKRFEQDTLTSRAVVNEKIIILHDQGNDHEKRLKSLEDIVKRLAITDAILRWAALVFMTSIVALIWGILTHQVTLGFP